MSASQSSFEDSRQTWSSPVKGVLDGLVTDGVSAFAAIDPNNDGALSVNAINVHSGDVRWTRTLFPEKTDRSQAALALFDEHLYVWVVLKSGSGRLFKLDRYTGTILAEKRVTTFEIGATPSLTVTQEGIYVFTRRLNLELHGFDRATLDPLFSRIAIAAGQGDGLKLAADAEHLYLAYDNRFEARSQTTGELAWEHEADREHAFISVEGLVLGGEVLLSGHRAAVISAGGLWMLDLESREALWEQRLGPGHGERAFAWPNLYLGDEDFVRVLDARDGSSVDDIPSPPLEGFNKKVTGVVVTDQDLYISRSGVTHVWERHGLAKTGELSFSNPIIASEVLMGRDIIGTTGALTFWPSVSPPRILNGLNAEAWVGEPYKQTMLTATGDSPPAAEAEILHGPGWLTLDRDSENEEWFLTGTPEIASAEPQMVVIRFTSASGLVYEHTLQLEVQQGGPVKVTVSAETTTPLRGQSLTLRAKIEGQQPVTVTWMKDGEIIPEQSDDTLYLREVALSDSGTYTVSVRGALGETISSPFQLTVDSHPLSWSAEVNDRARVNSVPVALPTTLSEPRWSFLSSALEASPNVGWGMAFWITTDDDPLTIQAASLENGEYLWTRTLTEDRVDQRPGRRLRRRAAALHFPGRLTTAAHT